MSDLDKIVNKVNDIVSPYLNKSSNIDTATTRCVKGYSRTLMELVNKSPDKLVRFSKEYFEKITEDKVKNQTTLKFMKDHMKVFDFVLDWDKNSVVIYKKEL